MVTSNAAALQHADTRAPAASLEERTTSRTKAWPDALHLTVLRHLGGPRCVQGFLWYRALCHACAKVALAPTLWHEIDLSGGQGRDLANSDILSLIRLCGQGVTRRLSLRGLEQVDDAMIEGLTGLLAGGPLRALDLGGCPHVSGAALTALGSIPTLEELGAECITSLEDEHLSVLCAQCPRLARLDVRFCEWLTDVSAFLHGPGAWTSLQLDGCFRLDAGLLLAEPRGTWRVLEELSLDGEDLDAHQLSLVARQFPALRCLAVSFARELDPPALQSIATLSRLETLTLKKATKPADLDWAAFFVQQRSVCGRSPSQWRSLNMAECELFSDAAAAALAAVALPALLEVDLSWCWHLGDAGLRGLLVAAPGLRRVKLAGMKSLTACGLAPCCRLRQLEELDCTSCNTVSDTMLEFLHRLFAGPPGSSDETLPGEPLPPHVARVAAGLWIDRARRGAMLHIKNYYAEYLEDWAQLRPPQEICAHAEELLAGFGEFG